jgi:serine/threonine-protein phosphatase 2A regulatory subunit A
MKENKPNNNNTPLSGKLDQITATNLLEDLQNPDIKIKKNAFQNLRGISLALGRERTRKELLPYLKSCIDEEEDEIIIELAKVLSNFIDCIGGKQYIKELLNLLEIILTIDDHFVRIEIMNTIKSVVKQIGKVSEIESDLISIINNLYNSEDINQKKSAMNLLIFLFKDLNSTNKIIAINYFDKFLVDTNISVKKELLNEITEISLELSIEYIKKMINIILKDKNDSMRIDIVNIMLSVRNSPKINEFMDTIYDLIPKLAEDTNWRVRLTVSDKLNEFLKFPNINNDMKQKSVNIFAKLLEDTEPEIRNVCCLRLEEITKILKNENNFDKILQNLRKLEKDQKNYVKGALASNVLKICELIGPKKTNDYIFPIFLTLIKDENIEIRMNLINNLSELNKVIEIDNIIESIMPPIKEISANKSWRIRIQIMEIIPVLAKLFNQHLFMNNIFPICITALMDSVFSIRESSCKLFVTIYKDTKNEEFEKKLLEKLNELCLSSSYLLRNTSPVFIKFYIEKLEDKIYLEFFEKILIEIVFNLSKDKIANVRMNCAFILNKIKNIKFKDNKINGEINNIIEIFKKDKDEDVVKAINGIL